jgi:glyoxylate carboligase
MTELTTGEALVGLLEEYGVDTVFGIPGVHNVEMYRALPRSKIRHILPRHEQGAGFMADGYARATGRPGVCFSITGPGLLNLLTPLGQAWSDSSNVLVVSSALDIADSAQGRGRLHEMISQQTDWHAPSHISPVHAHAPPTWKFPLIYSRNLVAQGGRQRKLVRKFMATARRLQRLQRFSTQRNAPSSF